MSNKVLKPNKFSLYQFTQTYANNIDNCIEFFEFIKWSDGFLCDHCGCYEYHLIKRTGKTKTFYVLECKECHRQHSLFSGTIFQGCNLSLYKFLLGRFLFFTGNKGISAVELSSMIDVNYKTALLLETKCRILMSLDNSDDFLISHFYEFDVFNIGAKSKNRTGCATNQQAVLGILSTEKENKYPRNIKLRLIKDYTNLSLKNNITGIYHGVAKKDLPLLINEQKIDLIIDI